MKEKIEASVLRGSFVEKAMSWGLARIKKVVRSNERQCNVGILTKRLQIFFYGFPLESGTRPLEKKLPSAKNYEVWGMDDIHFYKR